MAREATKKGARETSFRALSAESFFGGLDKMTKLLAPAYVPLTTTVEEEDDLFEDQDESGVEDEAESPLPPLPPSPSKKKAPRESINLLRFDLSVDELNKKI
ncbi:hypothetical protein GJ744_008483 [Endocarpon pusillum]|uniref:Uncharacterized protein n=1 Tax=Endocarpon pusillum TaxID=364733 RepID=A0A8H7DZ25_9EURO|nr:hypothetical protein GJ744_008483 [Endocarpon pusillum]